MIFEASNELFLRGVVVVIIIVIIIIIIIIIIILIIIIMWVKVIYKELLHYIILHFMFISVQKCYSINRSCVKQKRGLSQVGLSY